MPSPCGADSAGCPEAARVSFARQWTEESMSTARSLGTPVVCVKNTFIEAAWLSDEGASEEDDEEVDGELPVVSARSCPALRAAVEGVRLEATQSNVDGAARKWCVLDQLNSGVDEAEAADADDAGDNLTLRPHVVPREHRQPEESIGGALHALGTCKPCAWFWRPQGCDNGAECRHCHLCSPGELKARKHAKKSSSRRRRDAAGRASGAHASAGRRGGR